MTRNEAIRFITGTEGKIFAVRFIKRTTGETRLMNCRTGVKRHLKGGPPAYNFGEKGLIPVFDMNVQGYRTIPKEGITDLKIGGTWHAIDQ